MRFPFVLIFVLGFFLENSLSQRFVLEGLEDHQFRSVSDAAPAVAPPPAVTATVIQPAAQWNYSGTFTVTNPKGVASSGKLAIGLVKGYRRGMYYVNVKVGGTAFDGNMHTTPTTGLTYVTWFTFNANWEQVTKGTLVGTIVDGVYSGTMTKGNATGTFTVKTPTAVVPATTQPATTTAAATTQAPTTQAATATLVGTYTTPTKTGTITYKMTRVFPRVGSGGWVNVDGKKYWGVFVSSTRGTGLTWYYGADSTDPEAGQATLTLQADGTYSGPIQFTARTGKVLDTGTVTSRK